MALYLGTFGHEYFMSYFFFALGFTLRPASISWRTASERELIRLSKRKSSIRFKRSSSITKRIFGLLLGMILFNIFEVYMQ